MRRKTLKLNTEISRNADSKKHRTFVGKSPNFIKQIDEVQMKNNFRFSQSIVNHFINEILLTKCAQELNKRQLKKLTSMAMNHCNIYLQNQSWQLNPNGPHQQKIKQTPLKPDPQPQCRIFDPMLSSQNHKTQPKLKSQNSISLACLKKNSTKLDKKSSFIHQNDSKKSIRSNTSRLSKADFSLQNPKLVPLRFQNGITPQLSTRRTLQDFLREKKINADVNIGYKIRNFSQEKQNLKTIMQFPKSAFFMNTTRNFQSSIQNETKLPQISLKEDLNTDYDGNMIHIKKASNLKKKAQILKLVCKVKQENHEKNKNDVQSKYFRPEQIKLKPINSRKDSINSSALTMRFDADDDIKSLVQNGLYTNRIKFRQQTQSQHKQIDPNNQIHKKS